MKALGSMSILLVHMSKDTTLREMLNENVVSLINDGIIEIVSALFLLDDLDLNFVAVTLFEILSLVKVSCDYLTTPHIISTLVSVQRRLSWFLHHEDVSKVHRVSNKTLYILYNIFVASCNRVEYLADTSMLRCFYDVVVDATRWPTVVRKRAVSILVLFSFFPEFGTFLGSRIESVSEISAALLELAIDKTDPNLSSGACLDLCAFVLYQNLTHSIAPRVLIDLFAKKSAMSQSLMFSIGECLFSNGSSISAIRLVHVLACYQDKESVSVWKPLFDTHSIPAKITQLVQGSHDSSLLEAGLLACGSLIGAPGVFTWEILYFSQLKSTEMLMSETEQCIFDNTLARVLYKVQVDSNTLSMIERQSLFAETQLLVSETILSEQQGLLNLMSKSGTSVGIKTALLRLVQVLIIDIPKYDAFVSSKFSMDALLCDVLNTDAVSMAVLFNVAIHVVGQSGSSMKSISRVLAVVTTLLSSHTPPLIFLCVLKLISSLANFTEHHNVLMEHVQCLDRFLDVEHFPKNSQVEHSEIIREVLQIFIKLAANYNIVVLLAAKISRYHLAELLLLGDSISQSSAFISKFKPEYSSSQNRSISSLVIDLLIFFVSSKSFCSEALDAGCLHSLYNLISVSFSTIPELHTDNSNFYVQVLYLNHPAELSHEVCYVLQERQALVQSYLSAFKIIDILYSFSITSRQNLRLPNHPSADTIVTFLLYMWAYSKNDSVTFKIGCIFHNLCDYSSLVDTEPSLKLLATSSQIAVLIFLVCHQPMEVDKGIK